MQIENSGDRISPSSRSLPLFAGRADFDALRPWQARQSSSQTVFFSHTQGVVQPGKKGNTDFNTPNMMVSIYTLNYHFFMAKSAMGQNTNQLQAQTLTRYPLRCKSMGVKLGGSHAKGQCMAQRSSHCFPNLVVFDFWKPHKHSIQNNHPICLE